MSLTFVQPQEGRTAYRAKWLLAAPDRIEENLCLIVAQGRVEEISARPPGRVKELGPGLIMPFLVNAHLHLELSALEKRLDWTQGFEAWVAELIAQREALGEAALAAAAEKALDRLMAGGTGAVGEISTLGITRQMLAASGLWGIFFQEVLGSGGALPRSLLAAASPRSEGCLGFSLAGHAPHTTAPELLKSLKRQTRGQGQIFSIHLAESLAEVSFIRGDKGGWAEFLAQRQIDTRDWPVGGKSPVAYLDGLGLLDPWTLAVHLIQATEEDLNLIAQRGVKVCLCPRSNLNLHGCLPDIRAMLARGIRPALGTDSLASCESLSLFDEMAAVRRAYPGLSPQTTLEMAGINGAEALGLGDCIGRLDKGYSAGFLHVDHEFSTPEDILERLTANEL